MLSGQRTCDSEDGACGLCEVESAALLEKRCLSGQVKSSNNGFD